MSPTAPTTGTFPSSSANLLLHFARWPGLEPISGVVGIVHGFGEHVGRYAPLIDALNTGGYTVFGYDHRGHGRSPGQRGHIDSWDQYRADLAAFQTLIREMEGDRPTFLYGHSMGALVLLEYLLSGPQDIRGAILSGAPLEPSGVGSALLKAVAYATSRLLPRLPIRLTLETAALSRDPEVVEAYNGDPLVHDRTSPRWGTEALAALQRVQAHPESLGNPVLFLHGESDRLNVLAGVKSYFARMPYPDKTLIEYPGAYHEIHLDLDQSQVFRDVLSWLDSRVTGP